MRSLRILSAVSASAVLLSAGVAFAEEVPPPPPDVTSATVAPTDTAVAPTSAAVAPANTTVAPTTAAREEAKAIQLENLQAAKVRMETARKEAQTIRAENAQAAKDFVGLSREEAKARLEAAREEAKERMETAREEAKTRMEAAREEAKTRMETVREEAKQRLSEIKNKAKQQNAERIAERFGKLNKTWTDHFMKLLDRFDEIVQKMQNRAATAAAAGKDTAAADAAIQAAGAAIASARDAVIAQVAKTYTLDAAMISETTDAATTDEQEALVQSVRDSFQSAHRSLFNDLYALRDGALTSARRALQGALQALGDIPNVDDADADDDEAATNAASQ